MSGTETVSTPADSVAKGLDDVLLAMDVVDTLRHRERLVAKELDGEGREQALIDRLREIYAAQGMEVPDHIIREGVKALEERRFQYTPPKASFSVFLAKLYVWRRHWMWPTMLSIGGIALAVTLFQVLVAAPRRAEAARVEQMLERTIPETLDALVSDIDAATDDGTAESRATALRAMGLNATKEDDLEAAQEAVRGLQHLKGDLAAAYEVRVISEPGELSGVFRIPDDSPDARNYYLIVEAVDAAGNRLPVTVQSEENQRREKRVKRWGQRVTESVFNRVAADKGDDQIIQNPVIGTKRTGRYLPVYQAGVLDGAILEW